MINITALDLAVSRFSWRIGQFRQFHDGTIRAWLRGNPALSDAIRAEYRLILGDLAKAAQHRGA